MSDEDKQSIRAIVLKAADEIERLYGLRLESAFIHRYAWGVQVKVDGEAQK